MTLSLEPGHVSIRNCVRQYLKLPVSIHSHITEEIYQLSREKENKNVLNREMKPQETKVHYIIPESHTYLLVKSDLLLPALFLRARI